MKVESYISRGNSFPIIIKDGQKKTFVKLRAGMSGKYALLNEWIGCKLGKEIGINTQLPYWIELDKKLDIGDIHIEVKDLINKSFGLNIGFEYIDNSVEIKATQLATFSQQELNKIFLFDLMMMNIDRASNNINLIQASNKIIAVDYESNLLFQDTIEERNFLDNSRILQCFRNNPLYRELEKDEIEAFIQSTKNINLIRILNEIPEKILNEKRRNQFRKGIENRIKNDWYVKDILEKLKNINSESTKDLRKRANRNQAEFRRKFKENL